MAASKVVYIPELSFSKKDSDEVTPLKWMAFVELHFWRNQTILYFAHASPPANDGESTFAHWLVFSMVDHALVGLRESYAGIK